MTETTQEERNTLRYYGERAASAQGEILVKASVDADRLANAEALLRAMRPHVEHMEMAMGWRTLWTEEIDAFLSGNE